MITHLPVLFCQRDVHSCSLSECIYWDLASSQMSTVLLYWNAFPGVLLQGWRNVCLKSRISPDPKQWSWKLRLWPNKRGHPTNDPVEGTVGMDSLGSFKKNDATLFRDPYLRENHQNVKPHSSLLYAKANDQVNQYRCNSSSQGAFLTQEWAHLYQ